MPFINGIGPGELIIILIIALIVVGPGKLPDVGSALGKSIREFRKAATDVKESVSLDPAPAPTAATPAAAQAPAPAQVAAPAEAPATVSAPPIVPVAAAVAAAVTPAPAVAEVPGASADAGADPDAGSWPAEVTPVDDQQPTASAQPDPEPPDPSQVADVEAVPDGAVTVRPADAPNPPEVRDPSRAPGEMSLVGHLTELRNRLVKSVIAIALGSVVGWFLYVPIRNMLLAPLPPGPNGEPGIVQVLAPGDAFAIALRISIIVGVILAMPVILWQLWAFVAPGLTDAEKRTVRPWIPLALLFFALGVVIAYVVLPAAVGFLLGFTDTRLVGNLAAGPYFDFVTTIFLAFGLVLEFPIVLYGLSRVGIVTSERLSRSRRMAVLGIAIFAAAVTPGTDLVSPLALGGTMYLLYELTIFFIRRSGK